MSYIQATLTFDPEKPNMARSNGFGVWRVHHCAEVGNPLKTRVDGDMVLDLDSGECATLGRPVLRMMVARPYRCGVMVNPVKLALEYLSQSNREN